MAAHLPKTVHFVPAHPVAGTEHSGPDSGFAELFDGRWCILTPPEGTDAGAVERLAAFWRLIGAKVEIMSAEHHDLVLAITSTCRTHRLHHRGHRRRVEPGDPLEVLYFAGGFATSPRIAA
jgi:cyclohexadieny/prephenate dehydrogenase